MTWDGVWTARTTVQPGKDPAGRSLRDKRLHPRCSTPTGGFRPDPRSVWTLPTPSVHQIAVRHDSG